MTALYNFIQINGLHVDQEVFLSPALTLLPADTSHIDLKTAISICDKPDTIAVAAAIIPRVTAQLRVNADSSRDLAVISWNALWDANLLAAIFNSEIGANLYSDTIANEINERSSLSAINRHVIGFTDRPPYRLNSDDVKWIAKNYKSAVDLLELERFRTAIHCLASYRWHPTPRVQTAVIWAGIESLFAITSELRFRLSLTAAHFLHSKDRSERKKTFAQVKRLYDVRSKAVHGDEIKYDLGRAIIESAKLLNALVLMCVEKKSLPVDLELII